MRDVLREFYPPNEDEFKALWREADFVLDANVMLDVYRYSPATSRKLLEILADLGPRVWVPYQAALEYQRNRHGTLAALLASYDAAAAALDASLTGVGQTLRKQADSGTLLNSITDAVQSVKDALAQAKAEHVSLAPGESLHERLTAFLDGKVGKPCEEAKLAQKYADAEKRYKLKVPPGYRDAEKPTPDRYGDYLIWSEILEHAVAKQKPIILITGDAKDDWWWMEKGKTIGPRPELRRELRLIANVDFYMYSTDRFLQSAREFLQFQVSDEAIAEVKEVQTQSVSSEEILARARALNQEMLTFVGNGSRGIRVPGSDQLLHAPPSHGFRRRSKFFSEELYEDHDYVIPGPIEITDDDGQPISITEFPIGDSDGRTVGRLLLFRKGLTQKLVDRFPRAWNNLAPDVLRKLFHSAP